MLKVHRPAIKLPSGKVVVAPRAGMRHKEIDAQGTRGFVTSTGEFVNRAEAAKIAIAAGQCPDTVTQLHSFDLPEFKRK